MTEPQAVPAPLVQLRGLGKRFGNRAGLFGRAREMTAVDAVDLDIPRGQVTGVVGESGCGKSTLARLVLGLLPASSGQVVFDGTDLGTLPPAGLRRMRRRMQMVFQDPYSSIDPRYTVRAALLEPLRVQGLLAPAREQDAVVEQLMAMVGLNPALQERYPHQLSGGQKQRVGIARALALRPDFLVLDEPTASLDVSIQAQIIALLQDLHARAGLTYLFISHDLGLVRYFCSRIMVMYLGSVVEVMEDPKAAPCHPYTAALMASSFSPDPKARAEIVPLEGEIPSPFNLPPGCPFAPRCPRALPRCQQELPQLTTATGNGRVACFNPIEP